MHNSDDDDFLDIPPIVTTQILSTKINKSQQNQKQKQKQKQLQIKTTPLKPITSSQQQRPFKKLKTTKSEGKENQNDRFFGGKTEGTENDFVLRGKAEGKENENDGVLGGKAEGKENENGSVFRGKENENDSVLVGLESLDSIEPTVFVASINSDEDSYKHFNEHIADESVSLQDSRFDKDEAVVKIDKGHSHFDKNDAGVRIDKGYLHNSIESKLLKSSRSNSLFDISVTTDADDVNEGSLDENVGDKTDNEEDEEGMGALLNLCSEVECRDNGTEVVYCPLCDVDISSLGIQDREIHTNRCLDRGEEEVLQRFDNDEKDSALVEKNIDGSGSPLHSPGKVVDKSPVIEWLHSLGLAKYEEVFVREEVDWDSLQWLTEEDLLSIGITALGPRKKLVHALDVLRKERNHAAEAHVGTHDSPDQHRKQRGAQGGETHGSGHEVTSDEAARSTTNKLITDYFPGFVAQRNKVLTNSRPSNRNEKNQQNSAARRSAAKNSVKNGRVRNVPQWCCIPGTRFRVDAFRYLRNDCSHWFLTHFHMDHYQGLTRSFYHGKIYCSLITAKLVNLKIGIPWDRLEVLPLNQKINIAGVDVTCLDANHCPGAIIILFEPRNGKAVLHTGDFRFSEEMKDISILQAGRIHTLILDTTYCNPQYDFPKQEAVIQFVIEAIQAETFNPKTLFLIGSYTVGKERLFLEVARALRKKIYINVAKLRLLECFGYSKEDMQWFTANEQESQIHVVPMWTLASFKRLKYISNQYVGRYSLIVAFSPTGWTFGKGKKKSPGRRWQQGTIIRYEVPYSEHSSFTELQEFVKLISPVDIIPSVNNDGPDSANAMVSLLLS